MVIGEITNKEVKGHEFQYGEIEIDGKPYEFSYTFFPIVIDYVRPRDGATSYTDQDLRNALKEALLKKGYTPQPGFTKAVYCYHKDYKKELNVLHPSSKTNLKDALFSPLALLMVPVGFLGVITQIAFNFLSKSKLK